MNRTRLLVAVAFAGLALLGANLAVATTVQKFSRQDLAKKSESIVIGKVEDVSSRQDAVTSKEIYTYITLSVSESVKGAKGEKMVTIRQLGGTVGHLISAVPGMPSFKTGEEVVVFLTVRDKEGYPWVMGLQQGKYSVVTDENGFKQVRNELDGLQLLSPNGSVNERQGLHRAGAQRLLGRHQDRSEHRWQGQGRHQQSHPTQVEEDDHHASRSHSHRRCRPARWGGRTVVRVTRFRIHPDRAPGVADEPRRAGALAGYGSAAQDRDRSDELRSAFRDGPHGHPGVVAGLGGHQLLLFHPECPRLCGRAGPSARARQ